MVLVLFYILFFAIAITHFGVDGLIGPSCRVVL